MHNLQTINGDRYTYHPAAGVVFYGEADAADFQHVNGVALLADCGCRAETGCRCRKTVYRTMVPPAPAATHMSPDLVRRLVAEKRAEMRAEEIQRGFRGNTVERRLANEAARDFRHAVSSPIPNCYDEAIKQRRQLDLLREAHR